MSQHESNASTEYSRIQIGREESRNEIIERITKKKIRDFNIFLLWNIPLAIGDILPLFIFPKQLCAWHNVLTVAWYNIIIGLSIYLSYYHVNKHLGKTILMHIVLVIMTIPNLGLLLYKQLFGSYWALINIIGSSSQGFGCFYFGVMFYLSMNLSLPLTTIIMGRKLKRFISQYKKTASATNSSPSEEESKSSIELSI